MRRNKNVNWLLFVVTCVASAPPLRHIGKGIPTGGPPPETRVESAQTGDYVELVARASERSKVAQAIDTVRKLGPLLPSDDDETREAKLDALFALRDAYAATESEPWDEERVDREMKALRRRL